MTITPEDRVLRIIEKIGLARPAVDGKTFLRPDSYGAHFSVDLRPISGRFDADALRVNRLDRERHAREGADPIAAMTDDMDTYRVPGLNNLGRYGRWAFFEFCGVYEIESDFAAKAEEKFEEMIDQVARGSA